MSDVNHLVNKRPVAFKEAVRDCVGDDVPDPITPEMLLYGRSLPSVNCIPSLQPIDDDHDPDYASPSKCIKESFNKLQKVRTKMLDLYREEFFSKLLEQAVDQKDRYTVKKHDHIHRGDIVLIKEKFLKANDYPLALVTETTINDLGEITSAKMKRGDTGEIVCRHANTLIPLLQLNKQHEQVENYSNSQPEIQESGVGRPIRSAAKLAAKNITDQLSS